MESDNGLKIPGRKPKVAHRQGERVDNRVSFSKRGEGSCSKAVHGRCQFEARDLFASRKVLIGLMKLTEINEGDCAANERPMSQC